MQAYEREWFSNLCGVKMPTREEVVALMQEDEYSGLTEIIQLGAEVVPVLHSILNDPTSPTFLRYRATVALGEIGEETSADDIQATLASDDPVQKQMSLRALTKIQGKDAVPALIEMLSDPDPTVVKVAMQGLSEVGGETALAILERHASENPSEFLRAQAETSVEDIRTRLA
jgi:HEAT repeat protein